MVASLMRRFLGMAIPLRQLLLLLFVAFALAFAVAGLSSKEASQSPDWSEFTPVEQENSGGPSSLTNIKEMERIGGFSFVFPSYLPEGISKEIELYAWEDQSFTTENSSGDEVTVKSGPGEGVRICESNTAPCMEIREQDPPFLGGEDLAVSYEPNTIRSVSGAEEIHIEEVTVFCDAQIILDELHPVYECEWVEEGRWFWIMFHWTVESPIPEKITEDMRSEALKVMKSMIEAPAYWEAADQE